eukprot:8813922-Alexandrium_andersonii.AAC.1
MGSPSGALSAAFLEALPASRPEPPPPPAADSPSMGRARAAGDWGTALTAVSSIPIADEMVQKVHAALTGIP